MFVDIAIWLCTNSISLAVFCRGVDVRLGVLLRKPIYDLFLCLDDRLLTCPELNSTGLREGCFYD